MIEFFVLSISDNLNLMEYMIPTGCSFLFFFIVHYAVAFQVGETERVFVESSRVVY